MTRHRIEILGPLRILRDGERAVRVGRGKGTALLAYLATEPDGAHRDALGALLWPDADPSQRRQSLRQALYAVRKLLGGDPFAAGDRVALDPERCGSDVAELRAALVEGDRQRALELFRGVPFTDVESGVSHDFEAWLDLNRSALLQRLGALIESEGRRAREEEDQGRVAWILEVGTRAGLDPQVLKALVHNGHGSLPPWGAASVGAEALHALAFRVREGVPPAVLLALEDEAGWCEREVSAALASVPPGGCPAVIAVSADAGDVMVGLLQRLTRAPGGAAVRQDTLDTLEELRSLDGAALEPEVTRRVETALIDALSAVLEEVPVVALLPARALRLQAASMLAHIVSLQGGEGLALVVHGTMAHELDGVPVQALAAGCPDVRRVRASPPQEEGPLEVVSGALPQSVESVGEGAVTLPPRGRQRWVAAAVLGAAAVASMLGLRSWWAAPTLADLLPDHDVVVCSERSGDPHYYRLASQGPFERISMDGCGRWFDGEQGGDSIFLWTTGPGNYGWTAYQNVRSRRDLVGRRVREGTGFLQSPGFDRVALAWPPPPGEGLRAVDLGTGDAFELAPPEWPVVPVEGGHQPPWWLVRDSTDGRWDLYRVHQETGEIQQLTDTPLDEIQGVLRGDSLVFPRGRVGESEDGSLDLFLLDLATGVEERLTENDWNDHGVRWSPDGRYLCWESEELGHYEAEIMVMELRTRRSWNLSRSPGRDRNCSFTPDGRGVFYQSFRNGSFDIFLQPVQGRRAIPVSVGPGEDMMVGLVRRPG